MNEELGDDYESVPVEHLLFDLACVGATYEVRGKVLIPTGDRTSYTKEIEDLVKARRVEIIAHLSGLSVEEVESIHSFHKKDASPAILTWTKDEHLEAEYEVDPDGFTTWIGPIRVVPGPAEGVEVTSHREQREKVHVYPHEQDPLPPHIRIMSEEERAAFKPQPLIHKIPKKEQKRDKGVNDYR